MNSTSKNNSIYIIGALFFIFGFVTWINSVLIPFFKQICSLTDFQAYLVAFAFYISYFVMSIPSAWVLRKLGFVKGMSYGLLTMAIGSAIFVPAALSQNYLLFLIGLFAQGAGLALLQTASNPYVTILGPIERAAQRISIMGICNKVAGMIGIFMLSYLLFSDMEGTSDELAHKIITPYIWITVILILLAVGIRLVHLPEIDPEANSEEGVDSRKSIFSYPYFWIGAISLFFYVGAEVIAIDTLPLYGESQGLDTAMATKLGTFSLIALTAGYLLGIITVPRRIPQRKAFVICISLSILFLIGAVFTQGITSIVFIILLSFTHSLMWPSLWPLAIENLGKFTQIASAILIMGIAGGAILPLAYGALVDMIGNRQLPYLIILPGYLFLMFFALKGYKIGRDKSSHIE